MRPYDSSDGLLPDDGEVEAPPLVINAGKLGVASKREDVAVTCDLVIASWVDAATRTAEGKKAFIGKKKEENCGGASCMYVNVTSTSEMKA